MTFSICGFQTQTKEEKTDLGEANEKRKSWTKRWDAQGK